MKKLSYILLVFIAFAVSVSAQNKTITIQRFDKAIYDYIQQPDQSQGLELINQYPELFPAFGQVISQRYSDDNQQYLDEIKTYFSHVDLQSVYKDALKIFSDISKMEKQVNDINSKLAEILPQQALPEFALHVSGFKQNVIVTDSLLSISIDRYLGTNYAPYTKYFSLYQRQVMSPKFVVRDYLKAWLITSDIKPISAKKTLMSTTIDEGVRVYLLTQLLPEFSVEELLGYVDEQMQWSVENETKVWEDIIKSKDLYNEDRMVISKYFDTTKSLNFMIKGAPSSIMSWIGYRIVSQYVTNTKCDVNALLGTNTQVILNKSDYKF